MAAMVGGSAADFPHHSADQLFALAADIEAYPCFIPGCVAARIRRRAPGRLEVDNAFGRGPVRVRFQSQAQYEPGRRLEIVSHDGPFRRFRLLWRFEPMEGGGCRVLADYEVELRSPVLQGLAHMLLPEAVRRITARFTQRAHEVYGDAS